MTPKQKRAHAKFVRDLKAMRSRIRAFKPSRTTFIYFDALVENCLEDLKHDLGLDEWSKDDHPHAILARAHAVGALHRDGKNRVTR